MRLLPELTLNEVSGVEDLICLSMLDKPRSLGFENCRHLRDVRALADWSSSLTELSFIGCPEVDLSVLPSLTSLRLLQIMYSPFPDFQLLSGLEALQLLGLLGPSEIDLTPLAGRTDLIVIVNWEAQLVGDELLGPGSEVKRVGYRREQ